MEWRDPTTTSPADALPTFALVAAAWGAGWAMRRSAQRSRELADLAEQLRAERAETARLAVLTERLHIARELHDILAHSLSVMVVQVGAARLALGQVPAPAEKALKSAEAVGRESLGELRRLLGILRDDSQEPHQPQPGLAQLPNLVAAAEADGQRIRLTVDDELPELPAALDLTAYRLLQESVTNIVRHAPGAPARIDVRCTEGELLIDVWNGPPPGAVDRRSAPGHGLQGMRERVAVYGGHVSAAAAPDGSFTVHARLPLPVPAMAVEGPGQP
jgi:signal transduction histidine kinase